MISQGRPKLGQILKAAKLIGDPHIKKALLYQQENSCLFGEALIQLGFVTDVHVIKAVAKQYKLPYIDLAKYKDKLDKQITDLIPAAVADEYQIVPVQKKGRELIVAAKKPLDLMQLDNLRFTVGLEISCALTTPAALEDALALHYSLAKEEMAALGQEAATMTDIQFGREADSGTDQEAEDSDLIKLVTMLITEAIKQRASDIHVEPFEKRLRIRYRIDGVCYEVDEPPKRLQGSILARLKIMAQMDIAEKRKPQDGRIKLALQGRDIDMRVSVLPATHGESIVMRILDKQNALVDLEQLGLHPTDYARFQRIIDRPNGIFLVTGPTGSGKTTTLYAALKKLNKTDVKIITAENPVEYNLSGINQCQVNHRIELDFQRILRAMLRQAPNIILVGEIRDQETAEIAIQAALTGHLVFSTLHTNDAPGALTRLIDMGVKPFLVASSVQAIMAQRLVRVLCGECKEPYQPSAADLRMVGLRPEDVAGTPLYKPAGCPACKHAGYKGRMGIYELMAMTPSLRDLTFQKASTIALRNEARLSGGMLTLQEDGVRKVLSGTTSVEQVLTITHRDDL